jgi:acyl-CoA dehydrogenase
VPEWDAAGEFPRGCTSAPRSSACWAWATRKTWRHAGELPHAQWPRWRWRAMGPAAACGASLFSHTIGLPPILRHGSAALQQRSSRRCCAARRSPRWPSPNPVAAPTCRAAHHGAARRRRVWVIDGTKTFITSGMRADYLTVAVRTGDVLAEPDEAEASVAQARRQGISLIVVPGDARACPARGWTRWAGTAPTPRSCSSTGAGAGRYLVGEAGQGFKMIMGNFNAERLGLSVAALGYAMACYDEALEWARSARPSASAGRAPGDSPQAGGHADAHRVHPGLDRRWSPTAPMPVTNWPAATPPPTGWRRSAC